ncbi:MAG: HEPN domain-containing protein [Candidatus Syntrophoarchaeum sp.]|nr:HEPN domain-containing protein [Candidatus Syntrophoarchaeum sp.]
MHYIIKEFTDFFDTQRNLLLSLPEVFEIQNLKLRRTISADLVESELEEARLLLDHGFIRAAGAVAGVALERYLKTLCETSTPPVNHTVIKGINSLAQGLRKAGHLSETKRKKIEWLGDIRNKCDHAKEEPPIEEVKELINGTEGFVKSEVK